MITGSLTMDKDTLKLLAEASARAAASELAGELRKELREEFRKELQIYFGEVTPSAHVIQHDRIDKLLRFTDRVQDGFWGKVVMSLIVLGLLAIGVTTIAGMKFGIFH